MTLEDFKIKDARSYDGVADSFNRLTRKYTRPLAGKIIHLAEIIGKDKVLDIGTGSGVVALEAARKLDTGGKVVGIDLSRGLMKIAQENAKESGLSGRTEFLYMDAEKLEFKDQSFDAVVSLFALLHFPNPELSLKEIHRVVRIGGRVVIAIGSGPALLSREGIINTMLRLNNKLSQELGRQLEAPAYLDKLVYKYLPASQAPEESKIAGHFRNRSIIIPKLIESAQLKILGRYWFGFCDQIDKPEDYWEIQATFSSIARKRLAQGSLEKVKVLKDGFFSKCEKVLKRGGNLIYPRAAYYIVAERRE